MTGNAATIATGKHATPRRRVAADPSGLCAYLYPTRRSGRIRRAWRTRSRSDTSPRAFDVGGTRFETYDVRVLRLQLAGVLGHHDALVGGHEAEQGGEQRRLARAGAAADQEGRAGSDQDPQCLRHRRRERARRHELRHREAPCPGHPQGDDRARGRDRGEDRVQAHPLGRRASTQGAASSSRRPVVPASRCASRRTAASSANRTPVLSRPRPLSR